MINPENSNRPDDFNPNVTAGSEYPEGLSHSGPFGEKPINEYPEPLEVAAANPNMLHDVPNDPGIFIDGKLKEKKSKKGLLIGMGGVAAGAAIALSTLLGNGGSKEAGISNENAPRPAEPVVTAPTTPGQTLESTEAPAVQPTSTTNGEPSPTDIPLNTFEATPSPEVSNIAENKKTLGLEFNQTDEQLGIDFVASLETIYNQGLEAAVELLYSDLSQDYEAVASSIAADTRPMIEELLPDDYASNQNLVEFADELEQRNITRVWLYLVTDPSLSIGNGTRLIYEDNFTSINNVEDISENEKTLSLNAESIPITLDDTNIRSLPQVYEKVGEGSDWTANISLEHQGEKWVVTNYTSTGTPK